MTSVLFPGLWGPTAELVLTVDSIVRNKSTPQDQIGSILKKHKADFNCLFSPLERSVKDRQTVVKAVTEGMSISGVTRTLPKVFTQEVMLLSDVLKLNELKCVHLLLAGEEHLPRFPNLTRGLLAVLLYFDERRSLASCLKTLIQLRDGRLWTFGLQSNILDTISSFTSDFVNEGLVQKILIVLLETDVASELEKLEQGHALGDGLHRMMLREAITEYRNTLSDVLFVWACQNPLPAGDNLKILRHLKKHVSLDKEGRLEHDSLALFMTLLYGLDLEPQSDHQSYSSLLLDPSFTTPFHKELTETDSKIANKGLIAALHFVWGVSVNVTASSSTAAHLDKLLVDEDLLFNWAFRNGGCEFMANAVAQSQGFANEEYYVSRLHTLISSFISSLPLRVSEIQSESKDQQDTSSDYEKLLLLMTEVYKKDKDGLCNEFWLADTLASPSRDVVFSTKQTSLFKFVKVGAEQLTPALFVPYVNFISSISATPEAARNAYNLLRLDSVYGSGNNLLSWDHFFSSLEQYLWNIQEQLDGIKGDNIQTITIPSIPKNELEALDVVLRLTKQIFDMDVDTRTTMLENTHWHIVSTLFGLLSCPVVPQLKGSILQCVKALTKSPEVCLSLWQQLEATQMLPTIQTTPSRLGIQAELDDIEARNESYPETRGFLDLLSGLLTVTVPGSLGVGYRAPGLKPYLDFVKDAVFMKFDLRAYNDSSEMWEIAGTCLHVFQQLLDQFYINEVDLEETLNSPGYTLLTLLLNDSPLLLKIMMIIESASKVLADAKRLSKEQCTATRNAVKVLSTVLELQDELMSLLRDTNTSLIVTPLEQLMLTVNPTTRQTDFLLHLVKLLSPISTDVDTVSNALKLLAAVCGKPGTLTSVSTILTRRSEVSQELMQSLVEILETDEPESTGAETSRNTIRHMIVDYLISLLDFAPPNIGYYLVGFDITRPIEKTVLQEHGVHGCKRTCLHSVIDLLFKELPPSSLFDTPALSLKCYQLLVKLATNQHTGNALLRYLRSTCDFFAKFLEIHPKGLDRIEHQTEFLQILSMELLVTSRANLTSYLQRILSLLAGSDNSAQGPFFALEGSRKLLSLLDTICSVEITPYSPLELVYFDVDKLEHVIKQHQYKDKNSGVFMINAVSLHKALQSELNMVSNSNISTAQRAEINEEIKLILSNTMERFMTRKKISLIKKAFEAWRQVVEVIFVGCSNELLPSRQSLLVELTQAVLTRSRDCQPLSGLLSGASGCVVILVQQLRYTVQVPNSDTPLEGADPLPPGLLQTMIRNLVEAVIQSGGSMQQARSQIYAALLHCLKMSSSSDTTHLNMGFSLAQGYQLVDRDCLAVLCSYGDMLIESLCKDASKGHAVTKILAFSLLSIILGADSYQNWLKHLTSKGYLKHFVESVCQDNQNLLLGLSTDNIKPLFIYEAKLSFFIQIAQTDVGANALLESGIVSRLTELTILHQLPLSTDLYQQHQLVLPAFTLLTSLMTSLGNKHVVANREVSHFVCAHSELISGILKTAPGVERTKHDYEELNVVTCLLAWQRSNQQQMRKDDAVNIQMQSTSIQLQRHMINLLTAIQLPGKAVPNDVDPSVQTLRLQILTNVVSYCVTSMGTGSTIHAIFTSELSSNKGNNNNLNLLITLLQKALDGSSHHADSYTQLLHKSMHVQQMSTEEQRELASAVAMDIEKCSAHQRTKYAEIQLAKLADHKDKELTLYTQLIENLVFIVWQHVNYYMIYCGNKTDLSIEPGPKRLHSSTTNHNDSLKQLSRDLPLHLSEPFLKKIVDFCSAKTNATLTASFTSALVRRIKKLMSA